MEYRVSFTRSI